MLQLELDFQPHERAEVEALLTRRHASSDIVSYSIHAQYAGKFSAEITFKNERAMWHTAKEWGRVQPQSPTQREG